MLATAHTADSASPMRCHPPLRRANARGSVTRGRTLIKFVFDRLKDEEDIASEQKQLDQLVDRGQDGLAKRTTRVICAKLPIKPERSGKQSMPKTHQPVPTVADPIFTVRHRKEQFPAGAFCAAEK